MPYDELDRVIVRLLQNRFDGTGCYPQSEVDGLVARIARETALGQDKIAHVARQLASTHFKRHWPQMIGREEMGLAATDNLQVVPWTSGCLGGETA